MPETSSSGAAVAKLSIGEGVGRFFPADDGTLIHYREWPCDGDTRAVLVFLHGIASHAGWFAETAEVLGARGIRVVAPDRRGSGRSGGPRGHLVRYEQALSDLERLIDLVRRDWSRVPLFLAGS